MRHLFFGLIIVIVIPFSAYAQEDSLGIDATDIEHVRSFDVDLVVNADATIDVTETIDYDFGGKNRHGIFREIPYKYKARGGNFSLRFSDIEVTDENGVERQVQVSRKGGHVKIKIGDPGAFADPLEVYRISYTVDRALNYFDTHDELYWNVTGDQWKVPIAQASARVTGPGIASSQQQCFVGAYGSTDSCDIVRGDFTAKSLVSGMGLTVVVGFPVGAVTKPSVWQRVLWALLDNAILILPIASGSLMFGMWWFRGRDPRKGAIIPQWEIPDDLTPLACGLIVDEKVHQRDTSSLFIDLAIRGYYTITKQEKGWILGKSNYLFTKKKEWGDEVSAVEKIFLDGIFGSDDTKQLSDLRNTFYKELKKIRDKTYEGVVDAGYFVKNPQTVRGIYVGFGALMTFLCVFVGVILSDRFGMYGIIALVLSGSMIMAGSFFMPKRTRRGVKIREQILGLKMYMEAAEERRIAMFNDPAKLPPQTAATFERYLPYAMVLGVEDQWSSQFDDVYGGKDPSWYQGGGTDFSTGGISDATKGFAAAAGIVAASAPSSSSSGGSGFSGGGSGGGGGGGGGGSW